MTVNIFLACSTIREHVRSCAIKPPRVLFTELPHSDMVVADAKFVSWNNSTGTAVDVVDFELLSAYITNSASRQWRKPWNAGQ